MSVSTLINEMFMFYKSGTPFHKFRSAFGKFRPHGDQWIAMFAGNARIIQVLTKNRLLMKKAAFIPLAAFFVITGAAIVSCQKELPVQSSANAPAVTQGSPMRYVGGNNWNILYYFGTYDSFYGCVTPCGLCHATPYQMGHVPNGDNPDNNEALGEISVINGNTLLISVDLSDVGNYYVNDIANTGQYAVSRFTEFPQDVVDAACDAVGVPHWGGPVGIAAGNYPVQIEATGSDARLEIEGVHDAATGWSWVFYMR